VTRISATQNVVCSLAHAEAAWPKSAERCAGSFFVDLANAFLVKAFLALPWFH
jgi:hypothetical protein